MEATRKIDWPKNTAWRKTTNVQLGKPRYFISKKEDHQISVLFQSNFGKRFLIPEKNIGLKKIVRKRHENIPTVSINFFSDPPDLEGTMELSTL